MCEWQAVCFGGQRNHLSGEASLIDMCGILGRFDPEIGGPDLDPEFAG
jgi:hypothetical protein